MNLFVYQEIYEKSYGIDPFDNNYFLYLIRDF